MLHACGLRKTPAPATLRPSVRVAGVAPIRENNAFEYDNEALSEAHSSDDEYSLEVESEENEFRLSRLPAKVQQYFTKGAASWRDAVVEAIRAGIRNLNDLANLIFFMQYPARMTAGVGKPIDKNEDHFFGSSPI
jgi:hypothetical protein